MPGFKPMGRMGRALGAPRKSAASTVKGLADIGKQGRSVLTTIGQQIFTLPSNVRYARFKGWSAGGASGGGAGGGGGGGGGGSLFVVVNGTTVFVLGGGGGGAGLSGTPGNGGCGCYGEFVLDLGFGGSAVVYIPGAGYGPNGTLAGHNSAYGVGGVPNGGNGSVYNTTSGTAGTNGGGGGGSSPSNTNGGAGGTGSGNLCEGGPNTINAAHPAYVSHVIATGSGTAAPNNLSSDYISGKAIGGTQNNSDRGVDGGDGFLVIEY